jgi:hypothetical protein
MVVRSRIRIGLQQVRVRRGVAKVAEYRAISAGRVRISEHLGAVRMKIVSHYRRTAGWVYGQCRF